MVNNFLTVLISFINSLSDNICSFYKKINVYHINTKKSFIFIKNLKKNWYCFKKNVKIYKNKIYIKQFFI